MKISDLRQRVTFQKRPLQTGDEYGVEEGDFADVFTVWARIKPLKGGEEVLASRLTGVQPVIISVRYSRRTRDIDPAWRARDETGRYYNITAAANTDEHREFVDILARSGTATG